MTKLEKLSPQEEVEMIEKKLGYTTFERSHSTFQWIDFGDSNFNEVFGDRKKGIRPGIYELFGWESHGKSAVATIIASIAQQQNPKHTYVAKGDLEGSDNPEFNETMGLNADKFYLFKPKIVASLKAIKRLQKIDRKNEPEKYQVALSKAVKMIESGEMVCTKIEEWIKYKREQDPKARIILIMDSITGVLVEEEMEAGFVDANMRTNVSLASFLSKLCKKWAKLADVYNCWMIFINQLRVAPGVMFGNPEYSPGGKAVRFYAVSRVKIHRPSGAKIKKGSRTVGFRAILTNIKNKVGGDEGHRAGIEVWVRKGKWKFRTAEEIKKLSKKSKGE